MRWLLCALALGLSLTFASSCQAALGDRELTVYGGYNVGGSIDVREEMAVKLRTSDSMSGGIGLTLVNQQTFAFELAWNWRPTHLEAPNPKTGKNEQVGTLNMHEFHANFMWHPLKRYEAVTPFFLAGLGFTVVVPGAVGDLNPDSVTKFSFALGGGAKKYVSQRIGFRGQVRWHSTYVTDEAGGTYCDYYYGCYTTVDSNWLDEWDFQLGLIVRL